jgi:hypothetical protein
MVGVESCSPLLVIGEVVLLLLMVSARSASRKLLSVPMRKERGMMPAASLSSSALESDAALVVGAISASPTVSATIGPLKRFELEVESTITG